MCFAFLLIFLCAMLRLAARRRLHHSARTSRSLSGAPSNAVQPRRSSDPTAAIEVVVVVVVVVVEEERGERARCERE